MLHLCTPRSRRTYSITVYNVVNVLRKIREFNFFKEKGSIMERGNSAHLPLYTIDKLIKNKVKVWHRRTEKKGLFYEALK